MSEPVQCMTLTSIVPGTRSYGSFRHFAKHKNDGLTTTPTGIGGSNDYVFIFLFFIFGRFCKERYSEQR